ncbi:transglutaminase TgpA family protein [Marilutibacter chinensis]|uniref:DUF3488 and transglutaminase-like domain-containing protein n=1 Tax=Marilutibacter chinensis TaxID=2912247 RepID=A0ABS9HYL2_9GAMM|nr:DUF3488 and transglutaminase-like domain-containing protein [Lysobacter chinensis]MCF7223473.1 DUF3488 and transglutaminase-like domain-containing protein [Lysobacter chinensis]
MPRRATGERLDTGTRVAVLGTAALCLLPLLLQLPPRIGILVALTAVLMTAVSWRQPMPGLLRSLLALALVGVVMAMTGFSIGRDVGCALLAAMIAAKPAETYSLRDARSLLGFALFAPFATFLLDQGPLSLLSGLVASVVALTTLQRLADIEAGDPGSPALDWRRFTAIGRLLAIGLPLALAAFWLFPRLGNPLWGIPERSLARPGLSDSMRPGEWVDLMADDTPTLRVKFFGQAPPTSQMYWRGPVLWDFDGREWTQPRWLRGLPPAPMEPATPGWDYEIEVEPTDDRLLVALDLLRSAPDDSRLAIDHSLFSPRPLTSLTRWRMRSAPPARYDADLGAVLRQRALALPDGYNPRTLALARQWRREAGRDDAAIVRRALDWIRREFAYTLTTPLPGRHSVDEFLFDHKAGFCEHFSSAFVVLMRGAGIPARVVTGYTGGYYNRIGDYWLVRRSDAHAWAEVWLPERGWIRVDPTAAVAPERIYDTLADRAPGAGGLFGGLANVTPAFELSDWLRRGWNDFVLGFDADRQRHLLQPLGIDRLEPRQMILLFALAAAIAVLWMAWLSHRGERERDPLLRAWHRLDRRYARLGLARAAHETAGDWARRVAAARPDLGPELNGLSQRFAEWRYAGGQAGPGERTRLKALIRALRRHRPQRPRIPGEHR